MYYTVKFNNTNAHKLDEFEDMNAAIESARTLHNPDWPCRQGIRVKEGDTHKTVFDSQESRGKTMKTKPAQIKKDIADRCEAIAQKRRATPPHPPETWSRIMFEAMDLGLKVLERRER